MNSIKFKTKRIGLAFFSLLTLFLVSCQTQQTAPVDSILQKFHDAQSNYVMVAAHRAGHNGHPENSLSAIQHAIDIGVDVIEVDVKVTLDSVVVLNHDGTIDRTTNGTGNPESYTWPKLNQFRLKMPDGTLTKEHIATFEEAMDLAKGKVMVDIDIKTSNLKPVVDIINKTGTWNQVFFFDNDYNALKEVLSMQPDAMLMPRAYSYEMADSALQVFHPQVIHIDESFYTQKLVDLIKGKNARIWINALGDLDDLIRKGDVNEALNNFLKYGANMIQTDEPKLLLPALKAKGLHD